MEQEALETLYREQLKPALTAFITRADVRVSRIGRIGVLLAPIGILTSYLLYQRFPESNLVFIPAGLVFGYLEPGDAIARSPVNVAVTVRRP